MSVFALCGFIFQLCQSRRNILAWHLLLQSQRTIAHRLTTTISSNTTVFKHMLKVCFNSTFILKTNIIRLNFVRNWNEFSVGQKWRTWRTPDCRQESRAVRRKPRDAAAVLFGLKFADNIHYKFKNSQASKARLQNSKCTGAKQHLTQNGHSGSFKVTCFGVSGNVIRD